MPKEYSAVETEIKKLISQTVKRGTVDVYINRNSVQHNELEIFVNTKAVKSWMGALQKIGKSAKLEMNVSVTDLLNLTGVVNYQQESPITKQEKAQNLRVIKQALKNCQAERKREGLALKADIQGHLNDIGQFSKKMQRLREKANDELKKKYEGRLKKWQDQDLDPIRVAHELTMILEKSDINEELSRLSEHLKNCNQLLHHRDVKGKKLDFYSQELLREVNTIGSKSQLAQLTSLVVDAKSCIERFREQVQNVE